ncbi:3-oxoadipate enol-lactone hydrolase [Brevibacterium sediminis]|uniref:3-oxoadipate enol-lactone hydrolase n=2 Tax=Brevibacteriaceae TaxID=85019 RepID=A0ABQ1M077_9MICO|nr:3-oxoadipate enol-lactone hydrolase [Brevibacterium sediminis]
MHNVIGMNDYSTRTSSLPYLHTLGSGAPLALAHGAGGSVLENFSDLAGHLQHRQLFGIDYPGSGLRESRSAPLSLDALADELVSGIDAKGQDHVPVLGLSLGSAVAITAAFRHPDRVSGLILTVGFAGPDTQLAAFSSLYESLAAAGRVDDLAAMLRLANSPATLAALSPQTSITAEANVRAGLSAQGSARAPQMSLARSVDIRRRLTEVSVPTLVIAAGQDRIVLPDSTRALAAGIPGSELVELDDAGHIFTPAEAELWAGAIDEFLTRRNL